MEEQYARQEEDSVHLPGTIEPLFFGSSVPYGHRGVIM